MEIQKLYVSKVAELKRKYASQSASEKYAIELQVLRQLLKAEKISYEEFVGFKKKLDREYASLSMSEKSKVPGMDCRLTPEESRRKAEEEMGNKYADIDEANSKGVISDKEAARARRKVRDDMMAGPLEKLKQSDEWVSMFTDVAVSWEKLLSEMSLGWDNLFQNIQEVAASTFAVVNAAMQVNAQLAQANAQIEIAALEKRYDREIELAQGNSYLTAKLEKEKEKKTAEIKNKASQASYNMQVIQAITQAIQGSMAAYNSALQTPIIGPAIAPAAAAVALAAGMVNVALIKKQQQAAEAQGYAEGGFTKPGGKYEVAGVVHAGEWVASKRLVESPRTRPIIDLLEQAQRGNVIGSLTPVDVGNIVGTGAAAVAAAQVPAPAAQLPAKHPEADRVVQVPVQAPQSDHKVLSRLADVVDRLDSRLDEPFVTVNNVAGDFGYERAKNEYDRLMENKNRINRKRKNRKK